MAALTAEWFVAGFEPATEAIGIPTAFAALVIIPLLGNVAENYVALRYAWAGDGDGAMSVIMHSVVQIAPADDRRARDREPVHRAHRRSACSSTRC